MIEDDDMPILDKAAAIAECERIRKAKKVRVLGGDGSQRMFWPLSERELGEAWDRPCMRETVGGYVVCIEATPAIPYEVEFRERGPTGKWRELLEAEKLNPTKPQYFGYEILEE